MSAPITAADLAEALRSMVEGTGAKVAPDYLTWSNANAVLCDFDEQESSAKKLATAVDATGLPHVYIVQLQDGCWLADGDGDPPRTLVKSNAKFFGTHIRARRGLADARKYRPFRNAEIVKVTTTSEPAPDQDRAIIRRALDVIEKWDALTPPVTEMCPSCRGRKAQPQPQPRDESLDIALNRSDVAAVLRRETTQCGALVPFRVDFREQDNWLRYAPVASKVPSQPRDESRDASWPAAVMSGDRYVPYAQLEAERRDSELLDAILEAFTSVNCEPEDVNAALDKAVAERAKR